MIHVCFGLSDKDGRYSKFTGTAMLSMFENTYEEVTVHILHDNTLSNDNRDKLSYIAGRYSQQIKFYNVEELCKEEVARINQLFANYAHVKIVTMASMYRLLAPKIFPTDIEKIIYLDADIIVNLDINELWKIKLHDKPIAGITELEKGTNIDATIILCREGIVKHKDYCNAGVLIMNLKKIRQNEMENLWNGIKFICDNPRYTLFDQDILNYCFSKKCLKLPHKFNFYVRTSRQLQETKIERRIYHYSDHDFGTNFDDILFEFWFKYFEKTPWFKSDVIGHIDESFRKINIQIKNLALQISALMSGKTRAFFTTTQNVEFVKKVFAVRDDEEVIPFEGSDSIKFLIDFMKENFDRKLFFILFEPYWQLRILLLQSGFVEGRDFINASIFLSDVHGVKLNTYPVVRNM